MAPFTACANVLTDIEDPRRAKGKLYRLPHVMLFAILAISGCPLQSFEACLLDLLDPLIHEAQAGHVAAHLSQVLTRWT